MGNTAPGSNQQFMLLAGSPAGSRISYLASCLLSCLLPCFALRSFVDPPAVSIALYVDFALASPDPVLLP